MQSFFDRKKGKCQSMENEFKSNKENVANYHTGEQTAMVDLETIQAMNEARHGKHGDTPEAI